MVELNYLDITKTGEGHIKVPAKGVVAPAITESIAKSALASFADGADGWPLKSLTGYINPVQSGSGDPSPSNVRPITGWTGMNVTVAGKNLIFKKIAGATIGSTGKISTSSDYDVYVASVAQGNTYVVSGNTDSANGYVIAYYTTDPVAGDASYDNARIVNSSSKVFSAAISGYVAVRANNTDTSVQLEVGSTSSAYEPYNGTTYPISWSDEAGTVYGGYLDVVTGVLTVTHELVAISELSWTQHSTNTIAFYTTVSGKASGVSNIMSDAFSVTGDSVASMTAGTMRGLANNAVVYIAANSTDPTDFINDYGTNQLLYELATPQTHQLTPAEVVTSLLGTNNVWVDTNGDVECTYIADTKLYIDSKL